jgi:hypothetical protein
MNVAQDNMQQDLPLVQDTDAASQATRGMRALSLHEIKAVAGGPEGSVGTGLNPPNSSNQG